MSSKVLSPASPLKQIVALTKEAKRLESELAPIKKQIDALRYEIATEFAASGQQSANIDGMTVYLHRDLQVRFTVDPTDVIRALEKTGNADLITLNKMRLKAFCKELLYDETTKTWEVARQSQIPAPIRSCFELQEWQDVRCRKS